MAEPTFHDLFEQLEAGKLDRAALAAALDAILGGSWTPAQIAGFLVALRMQGETPEMITEGARALRARMLRVQSQRSLLLDTCGTGGDASGSVNLSTGAAIVARAAGVPIAKHGNRAASSRCGSADVLEALGVSTTLSAEAVAEVLEREGITFMIAPTHHPAMRFAGPVRKELKIRTLFNCLGPLANPAGATHQLVGAYSDAIRPRMAEALRELGSVRAWVVHGEDGMDEVSPYAATRVTELDAGELRELSVSPEDFGLPRSPAQAARGGDAQENAAILREVLANRPHPARDAIVLNAAAALVVALGIPPREATRRAIASLEDGSALATLERWSKLTQALAGAPAT